MDPETQEALRMTNRIYARLNSRRPVIQKREDYYDGKQPLNFATDEWQRANAARYSGFSDNWTRPVVDAEAERIKHTGLKFDRTEEGSGAAKVLWEQWLLNEMEMQSSQGFVTSLNTSRSYVIVWGTDDDDSLVTWEHPSNVEIEYDWANPRIRKAALKTWADEELEYATLYTADYVWKFERKLPSVKDERMSQAEQAKVTAGTDGGWVMRYVRTDDQWPLRNPIGEVPVVEIPNRPKLAGDPLSEIQGVMPMQDAINLLWAYLFLAADYASMDARVVTGQGPPMMPILDETGKEIGKRPVDMKELREKRLMYFTDPNAKIDSWAAAKLDVFTDTIEVAVGHIAAQTRTPPTYLVTRTGMSNVNGEGLKASEIGLVKKTLEFQAFATPALREIYRLIALAMGDKSLARQMRLATITWMNPEIRSESQLADALMKKRSMGYPLEYLMELDGLDPVDISRVLAMAEEEKRDAQIDAAVRGLENIANTPSSNSSLSDPAADSGGDGSEREEAVGTGRR